MVIFSKKIVHCPVSAAVFSCSFATALFSYYKLERSGDALLNSYWLIPWSGEQSPRKVVGLLRPGLTGGPKVPGTNAPMKRRGAQRGQWPRNNGFASC